MFGITHPFYKRKVRASDPSLSLSNSIAVDKLFLSHLSEDDNRGILITSVQTGYATENKIPLELEHFDNSGHLLLCYRGLRFHKYFPPESTFKVREILLKKSSTKKDRSAYEIIHKNIFGSGWNIVHIKIKEKSDCDYLFKKAIEDKYTAILAILLEFIDENNSLRQLTLHPCGVNGTPLHRAVAEKDIKTIEVLLKCNLDINATNWSGWTPLLVAIDLRMSNIVDFLINNGADINTQYYLKKTSLHYAIDAGNIDVIDILLKKGTDYKLEDDFGCTPFHWAVQRKNLDIINVFLNNQVDPNILNSRGQTPLVYLNKRSNPSECEIIYKKTYSMIINALLRHGANINYQDSDGRTVLHYTVTMNNNEFVDALLECNADLTIQDKSGKHALHLACWHRANNCIKSLLNFIIDIDAVDVDNKTALYVAVEAKNYYAVELILKKNPNINIIDKSTKTALRVAMEAEYLPVIPILLQSGADPNLKDNCEETALHFAIKSASLPITEILLENKADVNLKNKFGETALHLASKKFNMKKRIIKSILRLTNDIDAKDDLGRTAVHYAVLNYNDYTFKCHSKANTDVNMTDLQEKTYLHLAMTQKEEYVSRLGCIKVLIDHKADINAVDDNLTSPLHVACFIKNVRVVKYLLKNGTDPSVRDKDKKNVFHYVCMDKFNGRSFCMNNMRKHIENTLNVLVEENTSVNCCDIFGKTPLHYVIENNYLSFMSELLLNIGADVNILDNNHNSPVEHFIQRESRTGYDPILIMFKKHIIKMKIMKLWVQEKIVDKIFKKNNGNDVNWIKLYEGYCYNEIDLLKSSHFEQSNITYYNFLKKSSHDLVNIVRNRYVVNSIQSNELITQFPIYGHFLKCHFREAKQRSNLYDQIEELLKLYVFRKLPILCMYEILRYLDHSELHKLLKAINPVVK